MKTMKKSKINSVARRLDGRARRARAKRKGLLAVGAAAVIAAIGSKLRSRRVT